MTDEDIARFRNAARALAGAEKTVMAEVGKSMRAVAKPVVNAIRAEVKSSKGSTQRGAHASEVERQLHALSKSGRRGVALSERQVRSAQRRVEHASSLRNQIAAASGAQVSASDKKVSLTFKVRASNLPPSQRKLPRRWDKPSGWKHPVFGNRKVWVKQVGNPYFSSTIRKRKGELTAGVVTAMTAAAEKITHPEEGGAS
jgi:hypothetical protein